MPLTPGTLGPVQLTVPASECRLRAQERLQAAADKELPCFLRFCCLKGVYGIEYDRRKAVSPLLSRLRLSYGGQAATALQRLGTAST